MSKIKIKCKNCETTYLLSPARLKHKRGIYCSSSCKYDYIRKQTAIRNNIRCVYCSKDFTRHLILRNKNNRNFCSKACFNNSLNDKKDYLSIINCGSCSKTFKPRNKRRKYCCRKCFEIAHKENMKGEKNPAYTTGSSFTKRYYRGSDWNSLRFQVYKRDEYSCKKCKKKCIDREIQCHHIIPYKYTKDNSLENLITLCVSCHGQIHGNPDDYPEYIKIPKSELMKQISLIL